MIVVNVGYCQVLKGMEKDMCLRHHQEFKVDETPSSSAKEALLLAEELQVKG